MKQALLISALALWFLEQFSIPISSVISVGTIKGYFLKIKKQWTVNSKRETVSVFFKQVTDYKLLESGGKAHTQREGKASAAAAPGSMRGMFNSNSF